MTFSNLRSPRRMMMAAVSLTVLAGLAAIFAAALAQPVLAQEDAEEEDGPGWGETACDAVGAVPVPGSGVTCDAGRFVTGNTGGGEDDGGDGSDDGSEGGGSDQGGGGPGSEPGPGGEAGQGADDTGGEYGAWTEPINIAQGLVFICTGIGLAGGILTVGMAAGSTELHQKGIKMIGGTLAGFILGTLAVQIYNALGDVVVGF